MADPIVSSFPSAQAAYQRRVQTWGPTLNAAPRPIANAYLQYQADRVGRGQQPITDTETALALQAALTGEAQTVKDDGWSITELPGDFLRNAREITTAVPRMLIPNRGNPLWQEVQGLGTLPQAIPQAFREGDNLGEDIANLAELPGIRMVPGSYVVGNLAEGDVSELAQNPLMTALDVLPFASKAAKATKTYKAATAAAEADKAATLARPLAAPFGGETVSPAALPTLRKPGAFRTLATRRLDDQGNLVPTKVGEVTGALGEAVSRTGVGALGERFGWGQRGKAARATARIANEANQQVQYVLGEVRAGNVDALRGVVKDENLAAVVEDTAKLFDEHPILRQPDNAEFGARLERGEWTTFSPEEAAAADALLNYNRRTARYLGESTNQLVEVGQHKAQLRTPWAADLLNGEVLVRDRDWARLRAMDNARYNADVTLQRYVSDMRTAKHAIIGDGPETIAARQALGLGDAPITPTRELLNVIADEGPLPQPARVLAQEFRQAVNKFETSESPRVLLQNAAVAKRMLGRMSRNEAFPKELVLTARRDLAQATKELYRAQRNGPLKTAANKIDRLDARMSTLIGSKIMPARWSPAVFDEFEKGVRSLADDLDPEARKLVDEALSGKAYGALDSLGLDPADLDNVWKDAQPTWVAAKEAAAKAGEPGPVFLHHVGLEEAERLGYAKVGEKVVEPSQVKARTRDARPYAGSPSIAISGSVKDMLETAAAREVHETIQTVFGTPTSQMRRDLLAQGVKPSEIDKLIESTTVAWNPESVFKGRKVANRTKKSDPIRVPKILDQTMRDMHTQSALGAIFDPVMKLFRTGVLALSPRYQVYNVLGGAMIVAVKDPAAFRQAMNAYRTVGPWNKAVRSAFNQSEDVAKTTVPRGAPATMSGMGGVVSEGLLREPVTSPRRVLAAKSYLGGQTLNRVMEKVNAYKEANGGKGWFGKGVDASYASNQWWDDFYRTTVSIENYEKARKAGKGTAEAELEAVKAVRGVMQNWDELLPIERQILRSVFPFYNWARFSLGFVMRYPFDHPVRTAVVSQFARNELEDQGTGLPEKFLGLFQMGGLDEDGNARFLRLSGMNPFRDVTDWFTLDGLAGNTNPVIAATLQAMGYNPQMGGTDLYPTLQFDPVTGGLTTETPSVLGALANSIVPQTRLVQSLIGQNQQFNDLLQRDPEKAGQSLMSGLGLPILVTTENVPQEQFRAELNRYRAFNEDRQEAVSSGNYDALDAYPETLPVNAQGPVNSEGGPLGVYLAQLRALDQAGLLGEYRPQQETMSATQSLLTALTSL